MLIWYDEVVDIRNLYIYICYFYHFLVIYNENNWTFDNWLVRTTFDNWIVLNLWEPIL
jgi:hypothetical protein